MTYRYVDEERDHEGIISYKGANLHEGNGWVYGI